MKSQLSSFELSHLLNEFEFLLGSKIEKVFQQPKPNDEFVFVLHVPGKGKHFLYFNLPGFVCLSSFKPVFPSVPPGFASSLRRKINNARIKSITQKDFERILIIELSTKFGSYFLVVELFTPGNMLLIDENNKILSVLHPKIWADRSVLPGKIYEFPKGQLNPLSLSFDNFKEVILKSSKDSLVKSLATDFSLGGDYAKEVLFRSGFNSQLSPLDIVDSDLKKIYGFLIEVLSEGSSPVKSSTEVFPIFMKSKKNLVKVESFNNSIQELIFSNLKIEEEKSFIKEVTKTQSKFEKIISAQEKQLLSLEKSSVENQKKGELIYSNYQSLKIIFDKISQFRKEGKSWDEIKTIMKQVPQIKKIDESKGILELDLEDAS